MIVSILWGGCVTENQLKNPIFNECLAKDKIYMFSNSTFRIRIVKQRTQCWIDKQFKLIVLWITTNDNLVHDMRLKFLWYLSQRRDWEKTTTTITRNDVAKVGWKYFCYYKFQPPKVWYNQPLLNMMSIVKKKKNSIKFLRWKRMVGDWRIADL